MTSQLSFESDSEAATDRFAGICADCMETGLTIALNGELGSGKTRFVRAFCSELGVDPTLVTSPTFVLMQLYQGTDWAISHFDTYRLADSDEFQALGADDYLYDQQHICLVEWADRVTEILPPDHLRLNIHQTGATTRSFVLTAGGVLSTELVNRVRGRLSDAP